MIQQLQIRNFRTHETLVVDLDPFATTFVGDNGIGKTAVLKAVRLLCFNKPLGDKYIRWEHLSPRGQKRTRVTLILDDGTKITRLKGKGKNCYVLNGQTFKAMGSEVPEPIRRALNIGEENFQHQLDTHFWFSLTAGQVSKEMNAVVNLEVIDKTIAKVNADLRKSRTEVEVCKSRLKDAKEKRNELSWALEFDEDLKRVEAKQAALSETRLTASRIDCILQDVSNCEKAARIASEAKLDALSLLQIGERLSTVRGERESLEGLLEGIDETENQLCRVVKYLGTKETELEKLKVCPLCQRPLTKKIHVHQKS